jgi:hypothetical protein
MLAERFVSGERLANLWLAIPATPRRAIKRFMAGGKPIRIEVSPEQRAELRNRFGPGNAWIEKEFKLPLKVNGYP